MALWFRTFADYDKWRRQQLARRLNDKMSPALQRQVTGPRGSFKGGAMSPALAEGIKRDSIDSDAMSDGLRSGISQSDGVGIGEGSTSPTPGPGTGGGGGTQNPIFSPDEIAGLELWLDAVDSSTIIEDGGGKVQQWNDKSESNMVFTQGTEANRPTQEIQAGQNTVVFDANDYLAGTRVANNGPDLTIMCAVYADYNVAGGWRTVVSCNDTGSWGNGWRMGDRNGAGATLSGSAGSYTGNYSWPINSSLQYPAVDTMSTVSWTMENGATGDDMNSWIDGTFSHSLNPQNMTTVGTDIYIGNSLGLVYGWQGRIGEVIIYNSPLNTQQRQAVEGYLAWKWGPGSVDALPLGHPYKNKAPATGAAG